MLDFTLKTLLIYTVKMYDIQHIDSLRGPEHRHISLTLKLLSKVFLLYLKDTEINDNFFASTFELDLFLITDTFLSIVLTLTLYYQQQCISVFSSLVTSLLWPISKSVFLQLHLTNKLLDVGVRKLLFFSSLEWS